MAEVKLNLMLIGITGNGKSSTGRTLLKRDVFKVASSLTSITKEANFSFTRFEDKVLLVVDGPGMADTDLTLAKDRETIARTMRTALAMCYGGIDAFLFVTKFGNRFTPQDSSALEDMKKILGDNFMKHMIVVVTCGDIFLSTMENENRNISFEQWYEEQKGDFQKLREECEGRVVLINNMEKDEEKNRTQIRQVVKIAETLQERFGRYTSECFQIAEYEREKLILTHKVPELSKEIQEKVCLLTADIEDLLRKPSEEAKTRIRADVEKLKQEIEKYDKGYGVLQHLLEMAKEVEKNLDDVDEINRLVQEIETARQAQENWSELGTVCMIAAGAFSEAGRSVSAGYAAAINDVCDMAQDALQSNINKLEQKKNKLEKKIKNEPPEDKDESKKNNKPSKCLLQ